MTERRERAQFSAAFSQHPVPAEAVGEVVGEILDELDGPGADLAAVFVSPHYVGALEDIAAAVRELLSAEITLGCTASAVVGGAREIEDGPAVSIFALRAPRASLDAVTLHAVHTASGPAVVGWPDLSDEPATLLLLGDPFSFPADAFLDRLNQECPGVEVIGGLASAARGPGGNRLVLDSAVTSEGAVGVIVRGGLEVVTVVSQGCRPVGRPYVVTAAEHNVITELGGRPALERLEQMIAGLSERDRDLLGGGLHIGCVVDEQRDTFERGDFLIRNVVGIDRERGAVAIGDVPDIGQTVQFHLRDAESADEDLRELLVGVDADAALLFTCNGRGQHMFPTPDHDAGLIDKLLGPLPLAGMFCAGEVGPVGRRNFLHGFTASVALLRA